MEFHRDDRRGCTPLLSHDVEDEIIYAVPDEVVNSLFLLFLVVKLTVSADYFQRLRPDTTRCAGYEALAYSFVREYEIQNKVEDYSAKESRYLSDLLS